MRYRRISFRVAVRVWPFNPRVRLAKVKGGMMDPLAHFYPTWRKGAGTVSIGGQVPRREGEG